MLTDFQFFFFFQNCVWKFLGETVVFIVIVEAKLGIVRNVCFINII